MPVFGPEETYLQFKQIKKLSYCCELKLIRQFFNRNHITELSLIYHNRLYTILISIDEFASQFILERWNRKLKLSSKVIGLYIVVSAEDVICIS